ncbi:MAG: hypothetical protein JSR73_14380 [Proteobacteria bacterium]|nr:hypothetical protein [Pseudomonadota bacterium]
MHATTAARTRVGFRLISTHRPSINEVFYTLPIAASAVLRAAGYRFND